MFTADLRYLFRQQPRRIDFRLDARRDSNSVNRDSRFAFEAKLTSSSFCKLARRCSYVRSIARVLLSALLTEELKFTCSQVYQ